MDDDSLEFWQIKLMSLRLQILLLTACCNKQRHKYQKILSQQAPYGSCYASKLAGIASKLAASYNLKSGDCNNCMLSTQQAGVSEEVPCIKNKLLDMVSLTLRVKNQQAG